VRDPFPPIPGVEGTGPPFSLSSLPSDGGSELSEEVHSKVGIHGKTGGSDGRVPDRHGIEAKRSTWRIPARARTAWRTGGGVLRCVGCERGGSEGKQGKNTIADGGDGTGLVSIATVFLNKGIFQVYKFHAPATLVAGQMAVSVGCIVFMNACGVIQPTKFCWKTFKKVGLVSTFFLGKLVLDMAALSIVNIPMYGVLKSATTPFVLLLDWLLREKVATRKIQIAVMCMTLGGVIAGAGDLTFDLLGYILALCSAFASAAYVVSVGKLGDETNVDSFALLLYNSLWSLPGSVLIMILTNELGKMDIQLFFGSASFLLCFMVSCLSALLLNYATYLCTLENDSLTTSVVGRLKSILQGAFGLFAFGDVIFHPTNLLGLALNSGGIAWYARLKYREHLDRYYMIPSSMPMKDTHLTREGSQLSFAANIRGPSRFNSVGLTTVSETGTAHAH